MSNYTKTTNFATKDNLSPGNPLKIVKGTEIDTEYNNIATAVATKTDNSAAAITGGTIDGATVGATTPATGSFTTLAASGTTTLAGALVGAVTQAAFNTVSTTLNLGGAATAVNIGAATGTATVANTTLAAKAITASTTLAVTGTSTLTGAVTATAGVSGPITSSSVSITGGSITGITDLAVADGGTGASTAANARANLSAAASSANSDITSLTGLTTALSVAQGGTAATTAAGARTSLGLVIGTDVLAPNGSAASLTSFPTLNQNTTGNAATVTTNANLTGDVTSVGNATTLTNAPVIAKVLTGYVSGAGTVAATDSILQAIQKLNGNDATNANLTGAVTSVGNATSLGSFSSANLLGALTDETGTGVAVFATNPVLVTPNLGTPSAAVLTSATGLPLTTGVTGLLPIANGGTATSTPSIVAGTNVTVTGTWPNQTIAASGGGGSPGGSTTQVQYNNAGTFGGITGATTNGTALTLVAPVLGTPASATLTNATGLPLSTGVTGTLPVANGGTGLTTTPANGALDIGNGTGFTRTTLTAGSGVTITNASGAITIAASGTSQWTTTGSDIYYTTGKVGIGITTPISNLHVKETTAATPSARLQNANSAGAKYLSFDYDGAGGSYGNFQTQASTIVLQSGFNTGKIHLTPYNSGTYSSTLGLVMDTNGTVALSSTLSVGAATPSSSGAGITFPATQSTSSDANTLDDYEEGTWTPTLGGTSTYSIQSGRYRKIGALCTVDLAITVSSIGTGSSSQISGLPFTALSGSTSASAAIGYAESLATNIIALTFRIDSGGTVIANTVLTTAANSTSSGVGIFGNGARVLFSITYLTA